MPTLPNVALIACLVSGNCTKTNVFQMKLQRQSYSQWLQFCFQRMCDPRCPALVTVLEFLHVLRQRNLDYSALNSARGMLSSFATIEGCDGL